MRSVKFLCVLPLLYDLLTSSHTFPLSSYAFFRVFHHAVCFVIRSYAFLLSSYTSLPAFWSTLSNSDTFLYVPCDSLADSTKNTFPNDFDLDSMVMAPLGPSPNNRKVAVTPRAFVFVFLVSHWHQITTSSARSASDCQSILQPSSNGRLAILVPNFAFY